MMDPSMQMVWANGEEWVVKQEGHHYFYRLENDYGAWKKGTPPGTCKADMDMIFHT